MLAGKRLLLGVGIGIIIGDDLVLDRSDMSSLVIDSTCPSASSEQDGVAVEDDFLGAEDKIGNWSDDEQHI